VAPPWLTTALLLRNEPPRPPLAPPPLLMPPLPSTPPLPSQPPPTTPTAPPHVAGADGLTLTVALAAAAVVVGVACAFLLHRRWRLSKRRTYPSESSSTRYGYRPGAEAGEQQQQQHQHQEQQQQQQRQQQQHQEQQQQQQQQQQPQQQQQWHQQQRQQRRQWQEQALSSSPPLTSRAKLAELEAQVVERLAQPQLMPPAWQFFLLAVYDAFPPRSLTPSQRTEESDKVRRVPPMSPAVIKALRRALLLYHPDKNRAHGDDWAETAEEIAKLATALIEHYRRRVSPEIAET